jgi:hypothetical protein
MQRFRFPIAVAATSLALVLGLVVVGGLLAGSALARGPLWSGESRGGPPWAAGHGFGPGFALPPELAGLRDVPADQRFAHFKGARVSLTDKDDRPVTLEATPGTATAVSASSLTIAANDGSTRSFTLDDKTTVRGKQAPAQNDRVVVVTLNGGPNAHAVLVLGGEGGGPWGHGGWGR